jgi:hypothetical protein
MPEIMFNLKLTAYPDIEDNELECVEYPLLSIQIHDTGGFTVVEMIPTRYTSEDGQEYDFVFSHTFYHLNDAINHLKEIIANKK